MDKEIFCDYPDVLTVFQVRKMLGGRTSKQLVYRMLKCGSFKYIKIGREYRITKASVIAYLTKASTSFSAESEEEDVE